MTLVTGPREQLIERLRRRGVTLEDAAACVIGSTAADPITVNVDHADYPRTAVTRCGTCGSADHVTAGCPIPPDFNPIDYQRDTGGTFGGCCGGE